MHNLVDLGKKLKNLREQKKITRRQLANDLKINYSTLSNYENNTREPNIQMLKGIAKYFSVSLDTLLSLQDVPKNFIEKNPEILIILEESTKMTVSDLSLVLKLIHRLNKRQ